MDRGTDARDLLTNNLIRLTLGYCGVVNRSQSSIMVKIDIMSALSQEEQVFRSHPF